MKIDIEFDESEYMKLIDLRGKYNKIGLSDSEYRLMVGIRERLLKEVLKEGEK